MAETKLLLTKSYSRNQKINQEIIFTSLSFPLCLEADLVRTSVINYRLILELILVVNSCSQDLRERRVSKDLARERLAWKSIF